MSAMRDSFNTMHANVKQMHGILLDWLNESGMPDSVSNYQALCKVYKRDPTQANFDSLVMATKGMSDADCLLAARVFVELLQLSNLAPPNLRQWREYRHVMNPMEPAVKSIRDSVELVTTTHFYCRTLLVKFGKIRELLEQKASGWLTQTQVTWTDAALRRETAPVGPLVWGTEEDEDRIGLSYVQNSLWDEVPKLCRMCDAALESIAASASSASERINCSLGPNPNPHPNP